MSESDRPVPPEKPKAPDHWAELASKLGAAPPGPNPPDLSWGEGLPGGSCPKADSTPAAAVTRAGQVPGEQAEPFRPPREPLPPTDWDLLAEELGIVAPSSAEREDRPPGLEPSEQFMAPEADTTGPVQGREGIPAPASAVFAEDQAEAAAARFEQAVDLFDDAAPPEPPPPPTAPGAGPWLGAPGSVVSAPGPTDAETVSADTIAPEGVPFEAEPASIMPQEPAEVEPGTPAVPADAGPGGEARAESASAAELAPAKRGKRRRRRPGRKKKAPGSATIQGQPPEDEQVAAPAGASDATKLPAQSAPGPLSGQPADVADSSEAAARADKAAHRGIPTWEQAVGQIIAKNMEARPKGKHGNGPQRGRNGGRGSGRRKG